MCRVPDVEEARSRVETEHMDMLLLPTPSIEPQQVVLFNDEYHIKITFPTDGDVAGVEVQYILDDAVPRYV
jgi:hypothetical protein